MKKYIMLQIIMVMTISTLNITEFQFIKKYPKKPTYNSPYIMEVRDKEKLISI